MFDLGQLIHNIGMQPAGIVRPISWRLCPPAALRGAILIAVGLGTLFASGAGAQEPDNTPWRAGAYSFSDELGGFRITGISGSGTKDDPVTIREEIASATPSTMVIRTIRPIRPFDYSGFYANGFLHLRIEVLNTSALPWSELAFELQALRGKASGFGDGLSFDQRLSDSNNISAESFRTHSRAFEPYDRLLFREGKVDHSDAASFNFFITDNTPRWEFYLVQDPRNPSS